MRALRDVFRNPALRRLQLAWIGSILGAWAYIVALGVYAYDQGGPSAVGVVGLIRFLPAAILAPFTSSLVDRFSRVTVMVWSDVVRAALMLGAAATIAADGPAPIVYALVALSAVASTVFRPAKSALLPALVTSPGELTAANAASSTLESVAMFLGPALGGALLAVSSPSVVFAANGLAFLWSAALVVGLRAHEPAREARRPRRGPAGRVDDHGGHLDDRPRADLAHAGRPLRRADPCRGRSERPRRRRGVPTARPRRGGRGFALRDTRDRRPDRRLRRPRARSARPPRPRLRDRACALRPPARADRRAADGLRRGGRARDRRHRQLDRRRECPDDHAASRSRTPSSVGRSARSMA